MSTAERDAARPEVIASRAWQTAVPGALAVALAMVLAESVVVQRVDAAFVRTTFVDRPYWTGLLELVAGWVWVTLGIVGIGIMTHVALSRSWWRALSMIGLVTAGLVVVRILDREVGGDRGWERDPLGRGASWFSPSPSAFLVAFGATAVFVMSNLEDVRRREIAYGGLVLVVLVGVLDVVRGQRYWADVLTGGALGVVWASVWILVVALVASRSARRRGLART